MDGPIDSTAADPVGLVVVSHSRALADAATELAMQMAGGSQVRLAVAAGLDDGTLGTDAMAVVDAIGQVDSPAGVLVLLDLGSAVLSADLALEMLDEDVRARVRLSSAPLVEGLVAAVVTAVGGAGLDEVAAEASSALLGKQSQVGDATGDETDVAAHGSSSHAASDAVTAVLLVGIPNGLHARPAARVVAAVRGFDARVELTNDTTGAGPVSAGSVTRVATLGIRQGQQVRVRATGPQADAAVAALTALAGRDFDDHPENEATPSVSAAPSDRPVSGAVPASPGIGIGPAHRFAVGRPEIPDEAADPLAADRLADAIGRARSKLDGDRSGAVTVAGDAAAEIFDAHLAILDDPELRAAAQERIAAGVGPAAAWDAAIDAAARDLAAVDDDYQRGRAADIRAVGDEVLRALLGVPAGDPEASGVVIADDLAPAQVAALDPSTVSAVLLAAGSATSHAAILARAVAIPMVTGVGADVLRTEDGTQVAVDGTTGEVVIAPDQHVLAQFVARREEYSSAVLLARSEAARPAVTSDGVTVSVAANVGSPTDARLAADAHADGSGLVRTEFVFADRRSAPTVDEQEQIYRRIAEPLHGHKVVFRTLDAGGDKPLPFLSSVAEANPFLGVRGLRMSMRNQQVLLDQLAALVRVAADVEIGVMFPMVSSVSEVHEALALLDGLCPDGRPERLQVGIMVEVPSAALKAATFVDQIDFLSIGTNDLTQYVMAAERGNPALAGLSDGLDPAVLRLIGEVCSQAAGHAEVSVCGELAADPAATAILLGLGVRTLSVVPPAVGVVKQAVRSVDVSAATALAQRAIALPDAAAVRALLSEG